MDQNSKKKTLYIYIILFLILLLSVLIRFPGFYLPRSTGDQLQYLSLAMKLENFGFQGYNLHEVDIRLDQNKHFIIIKPSQKGSQGNMLHYMQGYWKEPLHHRPPLFPYVLMLSHKMFSQEKAYISVEFNLRNAVLSLRPKLFFTSQFYCTVVPVFFSILFILSTFFMGKFFYSDKVGLLAAILLSISPLEIFCSQKVLTADMSSFLLTLALLSFVLGIEKRNYLLITLSGAAAGLSILTRQNGLIIYIIVFVFTVFRLITHKTTFLQAGKILSLFVFVSVLLTFPWFYQMYKFYGTIFYYPFKEVFEELKHDAWFKMVLNRPLYMFVLNPIVQTPLFVLSFFPVKKAIFRKTSQLSKEGEKDIFLIIYFTVFLISILVSGVGKELRYLLPAFPALAILSARGGLSVCKELYTKTGKLSFFIIAVVVLLCGYWSISIGLNYVFMNFLLIWIPV